MGIWYPKDSGFELTAFSDADHVGCIDTRKSTSGGIQFLGDKLVSWMSKKQDCTAMSSAEAKYVALSASCAQVMWMRTQLKDYGFNYNKIPLYCDSQSAIAISCKPVQHSRTKHIHTRYHFIKEYVENGINELYFVRTEYQLADMFTKALPKDKFSPPKGSLLISEVTLELDTRGVEKGEELSGLSVLTITNRLNFNTNSIKSVYNIFLTSRLMSMKAMMEVRRIFKCWFYNHTTNGHQFTVSNRHQELASPKQTALALAIPEQTTTGKEISNPFITDDKNEEWDEKNASRDYFLLQIHALFILEDDASVAKILGVKGCTVIAIIYDLGVTARERKRIHTPLRFPHKQIELEPEVKVSALDCDRSLPEGVPFFNNMVIEEPEYGIFFTNVFGDQAFQRWNDIHKVGVDYLVSYLVMASMIKTQENVRLFLKLRKLIVEHPDQEKLKSKRKKLEVLGYKLD
ncbi:hypothetical protein Tco_0871342 [Tanacetum coccineum]